MSAFPTQHPTARTSAPRERGSRGAAMILVMVFLTLSLLSLTYGFERTRQLFAFEEQADRVAVSENGVEKALGIGIARLRSGVPDDASYACQLKLRSSDGEDVESYDVLYTQVASNRWSVEAYPSAGDIINCPDVFATSCPVSP